MKRTFRVTIIVIPVAVLLAGIGLWRQHYLKTMNAEPEKVYNNKPVQPNKMTSDANIPKVPSVKENATTDATNEEPSKSTQRTDNRITPEELDNESNSSTDTKFGDIAEENLTPEVVAAIKKYKEIQSEHAVVTSELISILRAKPLDMDAIELIDERRDRLQEQRLDALEILSKYSEEALNELQAAIESRIVTESRIAEFEGTIPDEESAAEKDSADKIKRLKAEIIELYKDIDSMTTEDLEKGEELFNEIEEERSKLKR